MRIEAARYEGGELILSSRDPEARRLVYDFKAGDYELKRKNKKRSLDANSYAWSLIDRIASATGYSKTEVYKNTIREIGGVSEPYTGRTEAIERLCREWERKGLGYQAETFPSKLPDCTNVTLYYGSSSYDVKQMSALIDALVQDCNALGIETRSEADIQSLISQWEA